MTLKKLNAVRDKAQAIRDKARRLQILRSACAALIPKRDGLPCGSEKKSRTEILAIKIADLEDELECDYQEMGVLANELYEEINSGALTVREAEVLTLRYVSVKSFRETGNALNLSDARVYALHAAAVKKILNVESGNS